MTIKIKKDIYEKTFIISNMDTNSNIKKIANIYLLIQILLQMGLSKSTQFIIILIMIVITLVIYINFIITIKNLKKLD